MCCSRPLPLPPATPTLLDEVDDAPSPLLPATPTLLDEVDDGEEEDDEYLEGDAEVEVE
jgi:hypothetical protein